MAMVDRRRSLNNQTSDIVIIGGGVIGTSIAYHLAKLGVRPLLLEKKDICSGTSSACDKAISLQSKNAGIHLEMALKSAAMFPLLGEELECNLEYHNDGGMIAIENERQMAIMEKFAARQRESGLSVDILPTDEARKRQPALSPHIIGSTYSPADAEVSPLKLTFGFARMARRLGATIQTGVEVKGFEKSGRKLTGVITGSGVIKTGLVINATGVFSSSIGHMAGLEIPIKPRRGQIIVTESVPPLIRGSLWSARYIVAKHNPEMIRQEDSEAADLGVGLSLGQTDEGTLLLGGTRELAGYDTLTTPEAVRAILRHAVKVVPALKSIHVIRMFAGLRPYTPDGLPIIGPVEGLDGFIMAAGHEGDGIALAPLTGKIIAEYVANGSFAPEMERLSLSRFSMKAVSAS